MNLDGAHELLADVEQQLIEIDKVYAEAVSKTSIVSIARPKVKSCLEHLRSALEYVAASLAMTLPPPPKPKKGSNKRKTYFPYGRNDKLYTRSLDENLPGLDAKYRALIDSLQPHVCGDAWLVHLAEATNFNKHVDLQMQERKNIDPKSLTIGNLLKIEGGATIGRLVLDGKLVNPKGALSVETKAEDLDLSPAQPVAKEYSAVKFILKGQGVDVLDLLKHAHQQISLFVGQLARF